MPTFGADRRTAVWSSGIVLRFFAGSQAVEIKLENGPASALGASGICGSVARGVCCKSCWTMPCRQRCLALWPSGFVFLLLKLCQSAISSLERLTRDSGTYMSVLDGHLCGSLRALALACLRARSVFGIWISGISYLRPWRPSTIRDFFARGSCFECHVSLCVAPLHRTCGGRGE